RVRQDGRHQRRERRRLVPRASTLHRAEAWVRRKFSEFKIQNIVGSCDVKFPKLFPGLIYRMTKPKVVLLIFVSGKIALTGTKVREEIYTAFNTIYTVLCEFRKP
ncbi:hypothetical protein B0H14DRAFT_2913202, partial [Mycena olivaceomarginata]